MGPGGHRHARQQQAAAAPAQRSAGPPLRAAPSLLNSRTALSVAPVASAWPSGAHSTQVRSTLAAPPCAACRHTHTRPLPLLPLSCMSQMRAVPSEEAEASRLEAGHQVRLMTSAPCPASRRTAASGTSRGPAGRGWLCGRGGWVGGRVGASAGRLGRAEQHGRRAAQADGPSLPTHLPPRSLAAPAAPPPSSRAPPPAQRGRAQRG